MSSSHWPIYNKLYPGVQYAVNMLHAAGRTLHAQAQLYSVATLNNGKFHRHKSAVLEKTLKTKLFLKVSEGLVSNP